MRWLASSFAFGGIVAVIVTLVGTRDMESYESAFFSLDRGTAVEAVQVLGHPVYTLALGLGVRLPLHGSLGASPIAVIGPYLPMPVTYWLLIAFSISAATMVTRHALEPVCGRLVSWLAMPLLFCSAPMVSYTVYNDWPETAVTYCAIVGCVFAPHAWLSLLDSRSSLQVKRVAGLALTGTVWGLVGLSHPGYWPLLVSALVVSMALALLKSDYTLRSRLTVVIGLATVSLVTLVLQVPDISHEITAAPDVLRAVDGPTGNVILANVFPLGQVGDRMPFTFLGMTLASLWIGFTSADAHSRRMIVGSGLISMAFGIGASVVSPGSSMFAPSNTWTLRDPAAVFAVLSAACAAGAVRTTHSFSDFVGPKTVAGLLLLLALQGPLYAARLALTSVRLPGTASPWNRDMTAPENRLKIRGFVRNGVSRGERLALWPGVHEHMQLMWKASTDFADAGYLVVTAWTKNRTMRGLVAPNRVLFDQSMELDAQILCDSSAVRFLQLRYLVMPAGVECRPWTRLQGLLVDGQWQVGVTSESDDMVRALPAAALSSQIVRDPGLSVGSSLLSALVPLPGTSLRIGTRSVVIRLNDVSSVGGQALVLPVAYDSAWHASSGRVQNVGGLLAVTGVANRDVTLDFRPDVALLLRALSMTVAQVMGLVGFLALGLVATRSMGAQRIRRPTASIP